MPDAEVISRSEANRLLETGEWVTDLEILQAIWDQADKARENLGEWAEQGMSIVVRDCNEHRSVDYIFAASSNAIRDAYEHRTETRYLEPPPPNPVMAVRIWAHTVYRVRPTADEALRHVLRFLMAFSTASPYPTLMAAWACLELRELYRILISGFEQLENQDEKEVLEAIHLLCAKYSVINFTALDARDFDAAYGFVAPEAKDIAAELNGTVSEQNIDTALKAMEDRNILQQREGRWMIKF